MTKNIEVEYSGPLTSKQAKDLMAFFDKHGEKVATKHRVLIDYSTFLGDGLRAVDARVSRTADGDGRTCDGGFARRPPDGDCGESAV